jgi:hypothetical protein
VSEKDLFGNETAIAKKEKSDLMYDLVQKAISSNLDTDKLEKILNLFNQQQDRQKKEDFEYHFAEMRKRLPSIAKKSSVKNKDGKLLYKYAAIEEIQRLCDPIIFDHKFCYSWREEPIDGGKRIWVDITGYGYAKSNFFDCPKINGTEIQNAIQIAGSMTTYGRRNTFISGFGIIVEGEDSDGQISCDPEILKVKLETMLQEKGLDGKFLLPPNAETAMRKELSKENPDIEKLRKYVQHCLKHGCTP